MSAVLLTIGFQRILLPTDKGLSTLLHALRGAKDVEKDHSYHRAPDVAEVVVGQEIEVEAKILPSHVRITSNLGELPCTVEGEPGEKRSKKPKLVALPSPQTQLFLEGPRR